MITYRFTLDLAKHGAQTVLSGLKVGDTNRAVDVSLSMHGQPYYLGAETSARIRTKIHTSDGVIPIDDACEIIDNRIFYKIRPEILSAPGQIYADLEIGTFGAEIFSTARFMLFVTDTVGNDGEIPEETYNSVITALANSENALNKSISTAEVDEEGNLIFTLHDETQIVTGSLKGPRGEKGERGEKGDPGIPDYSLVANVLKGKAEGEIVAIKDSSPLEHQIRVQIRDERAGSIYFEDAVAKVIGGDLENGRTYTVSLCELQADGDEFMIEFENGEIVQFTVIVDEIKPAILPAGTKLSCGDGNLYYVQREYPAIQVTKYGKNLAAEQIPTTTAAGGSKVVNNGDGSITVTKVAGSDLGYLSTEPFYLPPGTYTFSNGLGRDTVQSGLNPAYIILYNELGNTELQLYSYDQATKALAGGYYKIRLFAPGSVGLDEPLTIYPQLEIGESYTGFEPYKDPVFYTPNADGTVEGILGNGEGVTLTTDAEGVSITAEYNRDLNKTIARLESALISVGGEV